MVPVEKIFRYFFLASVCPKEYKNGKIFDQQFFGPQESISLTVIYNSLAYYVFILGDETYITVKTRHPVLVLHHTAALHGMASEIVVFVACLHFRTVFKNASGNN